MRLIDDIKDQYPHPISKRDDDGMTDGYCVGGALAMYAGVGDTLQFADADTAFPDMSTIAEALCMLNPVLPYADAQDLALAIIEANDHRKMTLAWGLAARALTSQESPAEPQP